MPILKFSGMYFIEIIRLNNLARVSISSFPANYRCSAVMASCPGALPLLRVCLALSISSKYIYIPIASSQ